MYIVGTLKANMTDKIKKKKKLPHQLMNLRKLIY